VCAAILFRPFRASGQKKERISRTQAVGLVPQGGIARPFMAHLGISRARTPGCRAEDAGHAQLGKEGGRCPMSVNLSSLAGGRHRRNVAGLRRGRSGSADHRFCGPRLFGPVVERSNSCARIGGHSHAVDGRTAAFVLFVGDHAGVFVATRPSPIFRAADQTSPHRV